MSSGGDSSQPPRPECSGVSRLLPSSGADSRLWPTPEKPNSHKRATALPLSPARQPGTADPLLFDEAPCQRLLFPQRGFTLRIGLLPWTSARGPARSNRPFVRLRRPTCRREITPHASPSANTAGASGCICSCSQHAVPGSL